MPDYTVSGEVVDLEGNRVPFTSEVLSVGSAVIPITGTFNTSQTYNVSGQVYQVQGLAEFNGCSLLMDNGALFDMAPGSTLRINPLGATYNAGGFLDLAQPGLYFDNGARPICDLPAPVHRKLDGVGDDPSWSAGDELYHGPSTMNDTHAYPHTKGDPSPIDVDGSFVPVVNVTRQATIEGVAGDEAFVISLPNAGYPTWKGVRFQNLGRRDFDGSGNQIGLAGKFANHIHKMLDNSRGGEISDCVFINCTNMGLWPHNSHGLNLKRNVVLFTSPWGAGWDLGSGATAFTDNHSDDLYYEDNEFMDIDAEKDFRHLAFGFVLAQGSNIVVGPGNRIDGVNGKGVYWPEIGGGFNDYHAWTWLAPFIVTHTVVGNFGKKAAIDIWQNAPNTTDTFPIVARIGGTGWRFGAYVLPMYTGEIEEISFEVIGISSHLQSNNRGDGWGARGVGKPGVNEHVHDCDVGIRFEKHNVAPGNCPVLYADVKFARMAVSVIDDISASNNGQFPTIADIPEATIDGVYLTDFMADGVQVPASIFDPVQTVAGSVFRFQGGSVAFEVHEDGIAHAIAPFY